MAVDPDWFVITKSISSSLSSPVVPPFAQLRVREPTEGTVRAREPPLAKVPALVKPRGTARLASLMSEPPKLFARISVPVRAAEVLSFATSELLTCPLVMSSEKTGVRSRKGVRGPSRQSKEEGEISDGVTPEM